nr:histidine kinase [Vicinamibacterales bacterium]
MRSPRPLPLPVHADVGARAFRLLLALLAAVAPALGASAPEPARDVTLPAASGMTTRTWDTDEGLPDASVMAIAQTRDGYLWIGTRGGLARFDGVRFVTYDERTEAGWTSDHVDALAAGADGSLWIGLVDGGLLRHRDGRFEAVAVPSPTVRALHEARDGTLWAALDRGLARVRDGRLADLVGPFTGTYVYAFLEDPDGSMWIGASTGLWLCRAGSCGPMTEALGLPARPVQSLRRAADGTLYVGTAGAGLFRLRGPKAEPVAGETGPIWSVREDRRGNVWVATDNGLKSLQPAGLARAFPHHGLSGRVLALFVDREGSLWAGTRYGGLVRLTAGRATSIGHEFEHPSVLSVLEDRQGRIWFGMAGGGLGRLEGSRLASYGLREGLVSDIVGPVLEDREGRLWFGPRAGGRLQRIEHGTVRGLPLRGTPAAFHEDLEGALWVGTTGDGLYRLRAGQLTQWTTSDGLPSRAVRAMADDGEGGLWLGTPRGLVRFRDRPQAVYTTADGLLSDRVVALHREPEGPLWIGTARGLNRFEEGRFTAYGPEQGLCDNQVHAIVDDRLGNLWMTSSRGLFHVSRQQLDELARGQRTTVACTMLGTGDGMESAQFNAGYQPSGWRARDGRLWFPSVRGLVVVDPTRQHAANFEAPPVWIETARADGSDVALSGGTGLPAGTRRLEIEYTALSLVAPEKVQFRHRLQGFDSQWVEAGSRRRISYTNLPPGEYRFEVMACNNDGVWNEAGHHWAFRIAPLLHQTWWFKGAMGLLLAGAGLGLHALRVRDLRLRNAVLAERARLSQEIHDHISQIMTGIVLQLDAASQVLTQGGGTGAAYIARASRLARQGIEETRLILHSLREGAAVRVAGDTSLDEALAETVAPLVEGTGVRLHARRRGEPFPLPAGARDAIFHVGQEAVTNALRHGRPSTVDIL